MALDRNTLVRFTEELLLVKKIGIKTFVKLLHIAGSIERLYKIELPDEIKDTYGYSIKIAIENINVDKPISKCKCIWESDYPRYLKQITSPPPILYYEGEWNNNLFEKSISIVGTRRASSLGKKITNELSNSISKIGIAVVSGLAQGIDMEAHKASYSNTGRTIAVLGTPISQQFKIAKEPLYTQIIENAGLILSEFSQNQSVYPGMFAQRNRIIAGLNDKTIVVEAGIKSGALITANYAYEENREVYAIPWNIYFRNGEGCNMLIKDNKAKILLSINDIFENSNSESFIIDKQKNFNTAVNLEKDELSVYNQVLLASSSVEEICGNLNKSYDSVILLCTNLELKGIITKDKLTGKYTINK